MLSIEEIKRLLLEFHEARGFKVFESFPLLSNDSTVLFTNAAITPFKGWFTDCKIEPYNFALIQKCFRPGDSANDYEAGFDAKTQTFFEMFGVGMFGINHEMAIGHLLKVLTAVGLDTSKLYFTIPRDDDFQQGLIANNVRTDRIFVINGNESFWCHWRFGKHGLVGRGLTVVYSKNEMNILNVEQLVSENCVELLNLIFIFGQENRLGEVIAATNPGFEIGIGIGRIASILQDCDDYAVDNIDPLMVVLREYFYNLNIRADIRALRLMIDYLSAVCVLVSEGLLPSSKSAGYVLRKIIRRFTEHVWQAFGRSIFAVELIEKFVNQFRILNPDINLNEPDIMSVLRHENGSLERVLSRGVKFIQRHPDSNYAVLLDTYGLSPILINLAKKEISHENQIG